MQAKEKITRKELTGTLLVNEIFGPTFQGEGSSLGTPCMFLRLAICNLKCVWCDTKYTWDFDSDSKGTEFSGPVTEKYDYQKEVKRMTSEEIWAELSKGFSSEDINMLVVSGGEPLLQQAKLYDLLWKIRNFVSIARHTIIRVEVETAGTIEPDKSLFKVVDQFNVSPKLEHSGNSLGSRYVPKALSRFASVPADKVKFKFVAQEVVDLEEVAKLVNMFAISNSQVYIMPEGVSAESISRHTENIADAVVARGWNLTTRLHVLAYQNRRGK
jgi:7-carboxy-7-deazaguanine synthase